MFSICAPLIQNPRFLFSCLPNLDFLHSILLQHSILCRAIDNALRPFTVAAPSRTGTAHAAPKSHETNIPSFKANPQTAAWLSCAHEDKGRTRHARAPAAARPETASAQRHGATLRPPHPGVIFRLLASHLVLKVFTRISCQIAIWPSKIEI
jgi:hypothetical protein